MTDTDETWMQRALALAREGARQAEVPVGAVLIGGDGRVLAEAFNQPIGRSDPTAHAEILVLRRAGVVAGNYRLLNTTLYVTVEPCVMCMGAIVHARVTRVVFGAADPRWGGAGSLYDLSADPRLNHRVAVRGGVCADAARELLQRFFRARREKSRAAASDPPQDLPGGAEPVPFAPSTPEFNNRS